MYIDRFQQNSYPSKYKLKYDQLSPVHTKTISRLYKENGNKMVYVFLIF